MVEKDAETERKRAVIEAEKLAMIQKIKTDAIVRILNSATQCLAMQTF